MLLPTVHVASLLRLADFGLNVTRVDGDVSKRLLQVLDIE